MQSQRQGIFQREHTRDTSGNAFSGAVPGQQLRRNSRAEPHLRQRIGDAECNLDSCVGRHRLLRVEFESGCGQRLIQFLADDRFFLVQFFD